MTEQGYTHRSGFAVFQRRGKAKFVNVIQHTRSCSLLYWAAMCRAGLRGGQRGQLPRAPRC